MVGLEVWGRFLDIRVKKMMIVKWMERVYVILLLCVIGMIKIKMLRIFSIKIGSNMFMRKNMDFFFNFMMKWM